MKLDVTQLRLAAAGSSFSGDGTLVRIPITSDLGVIQARA